MLSGDHRCCLGAVGGGLLRSWRAIKADPRQPPETSVPSLLTLETREPKSGETHCALRGGGGEMGGTASCYESSKVFSATKCWGSFIVFGHSTAISFRPLPCAVVTWGDGVVKESVFIVWSCRVCSRQNHREEAGADVDVRGSEAFWYWGEALRKTWDLVQITSYTPTEAHYNWPQASSLCPKSVKIGIFYIGRMQHDTWPGSFLFYLWQSSEKLRVSVPTVTTVTPTLAKTFIQMCMRVQDGISPQHRVSPGRLLTLNFNPLRVYLFILLLVGVFNTVFKGSTKNASSAPRHMPLPLTRSICVPKGQPWSCPLSVRIPRWSPCSQRSSTASRSCPVLLGIASQKCPPRTPSDSCASWTASLTPGRCWTGSLRTTSL